MMIKHICSKKTKLEEGTIKHLVSIDGEYYVFIFNKDKIFKFLHKSDEYFFSKCKIADKIIDLLKEKDDKALGIHDYYVDDRYEEEVYRSIYSLFYEKQDVIKELNHLKDSLKKLSK